MLDSVVDELTVHRVPASHPAGPERIELWLYSQTLVGDLDLRRCDQCKLAVLEHIRIDSPYRRRGLAARALHEVFAELRSYRWCTTEIDDTPAAQAFWSSIPWPGDARDLGQPHYCEHMRQAESTLGCE
jgi:hypothetical protein